MSSSSKRTGGWVFFVIAMGIGVGLAPIDAAWAGDVDKLYEALEKAAAESGDVPALAKKFVPTVKGATKEAKEGLPEKLTEEYNLAEMTLEEDKMAMLARMTCLVYLAAKEVGDSGLYGAARMLLWQKLFDTAGSPTMDMDDKVEEGGKLAKNWSSIWEDLFLTVMKEHGVMEAKGDTASMKQYMDQMEIMAKGWQKATGKDDLLKKFEDFKEALEKWKKLSPEERSVKKDAEAAYQRADERLKHKELHPAQSILETAAIPKFEKIKDLRGLMKCWFLLAKVFEAMKQFWKIEECVEKAKEYAAQVKDVGFTSECDSYLKTLKDKGVDTTKNPFTMPGNLADPVKIKLKPAYGQVRESRPLPQALENHYFWRPVDLETGTDDEGKPKYAKKLPFPGPSIYWLIWKGGADLKLAEDEKGTRGRNFKVGKFTPSKETVNILYWDADKNKNVIRPYKLLAIEN
ncbi:MAG: hypothetical protein ACYS47_02965, partial [Planctomycetota bacterium]